MMYNNIVLDCFFSPQHVGVLDVDQDFCVVFESIQKNKPSIACYMLCDKNAVIQKLCFKTNGNPYLIAGLEWACRYLDGCSIDKISQIDYQCLIKALDIPLAQYPLALRIVAVLKELLSLMKKVLAL